MSKTRKHAQFGAVPGDLVDQFVRKKYIKAEKILVVEGESKGYALAENGLHQVSPEMIQSYIDEEMKDES